MVPVGHMMHTSTLKGYRGLGPPSSPEQGISPLHTLPGIPLGSVSSVLLQKPTDSSPTFFLSSCASSPACEYQGPGDGSRFPGSRNPGEWYPGLLQ